MFNRMMIVCALLLGAFVFSGVMSAATKDPQANEKAQAWLTNYESAVAKAKASKRIVLADFTGSDWCGFCIKLKKEVLDTPEFKEMAAREFVLLELDFPRAKEQPDKIKEQNNKLKDQFKVRGFPTVVFLTGEGKELGRVVGFGGKDQWLAQVKGIVEKNAAEKPVEK